MTDLSQAAKAREVADLIAELRERHASLIGRVIASDQDQTIFSRAAAALVAAHAEGVEAATKAAVSWAQTYDTERMDDKETEELLTEHIARRSPHQGEPR